MFQSKEKIYFFSFLFSSVFLFFFLPFISQDFGITFDEQLHNEHGKILLTFFEGNSEEAIQSPFNSDGQLIIASEERGKESYKGMNIFGGFFDLLTAFFYKHFNLLGEYETRHVLNSLFGFLGIIFTGLLAKRIGGWRAGLTALIFITLSPRYIGHSMNNSQDIPFAAMYIFSIYFLFKFLEEIPKPKLSTVVFLIIGIAVSTCIRISGLLIFGYLFLFLIAKYLPRLITESENNNEFKDFIRSSLWGLSVLIFSYILILIFWPYLRTNPVSGLITIVIKMTNFDVFNAIDLFEGRWLNRWEIPWYFVPKWILISTPLFILSGIVLTPFIFINRFGEISKKNFALLIFVFVFPVLYVIFSKSNIYGDARHLLFCFPPIVVFSALGFENILRGKFPGFVTPAVIFIVFLFCLEPFLWMKKNHPNEVVYFSPIIGGVDGAFKKYETEYYGNVLRQGVEWIQKNEPKGTTDKPIRIRAWYGTPLCTSYYINKKEGYKYVKTVEESPDWDYSILMIAASKQYHDWLFQWPPPNTLHQIFADSTPLLAIIKNDFAEDNSIIKYFNLGFSLYQEKKFPKAIEMFKKTISFDSLHVLAYNNLGACYGDMALWKEEIDACEKALLIKPDFQLARNNIEYAKSQMNHEKIVSEEIKLKSEKDLIQYSYSLYLEKKFADVILVSRLIISKNKKNAMAFNNLCASLNSLQRFEEGMNACQKSLEISPDFQLAKNNLAYSKSEISTNK